MEEEFLDETLRGHGVRLEWADLPVEVRRGIEHVLGARVIEAVSQRGGFSPGVAARVRLSDGRRLFVKAAGYATNPDSPEINRREAMVAASLPSSVPAPRFVASFDEGGWVALVFQEADGHPPQLPWRSSELERVVVAVGDLAASLTPAPITLPSIANDPHPDFAGFHELRAAATGGDPLGDLDPWIVRNLDRLADATTQWSEATAGNTLLHQDIRADNLLLTEDRVLFVDWPHATVGAAWMDLLCMLPSIAMQGGPPPWELFDDHPLTRDADPEAVVVALAGLTALFVIRGRRPDPPGLPTVRRFQRAQGVEALRWLERRTGWA